MRSSTVPLSSAPRALLFLPLAVLAATALPAQGHVNASLLKAPDDDATATAAHQSASAAVVQRARGAVVYVYVEVAGPRGAFAIERASTGAIVDPSGLIVTWKHLVQEAAEERDKTLFVQFDDATNSRVPASIVRFDEATGLVLLQAAPPAGPLPFVELAADRPLPGEPVVVLARPEGKEMLAFAGVASPALVPVMHRGVSLSPDAVFMTDSRNDERCDGALVLDGAGRLLGLYGAEHVLRDKSEPTLADLEQPSFGLVVSTGGVRQGFAKDFAAIGGKNPTLLASPPTMPSAAAVAVQRVAPSVVSVWAGAGEWPQLGANDPGGVQRREGLGSGVVLGKKGLVVCNLHVCEAGPVRVRTLHGQTYPAKILKKNTGSNLALLQVELPAGTMLTAAACDPDDDTQLGETVLAVGNPIGTQVVVSAGVVSARRDREGGRIQADPNLGNQNGGGAIVDLTGRVVGIGDAGAQDPLVQAFETRGDRVTTETNLSTFLGIRRVRKVFESAFAEGADAEESIRMPAPVPAADLALRESALTKMVKQSSGALLNIYISRNVAKVDPDDPFASMAEPVLVTLSLGSGVIIDRSGLAISNWHVVDDATYPDGSMRADHVVTARVFGGKEYPVRVLSISREDDLSLLQLVLAPGEEVQAVDLGSSQALAIGESVAAIGNPHGRANTITYGVVSAKDQGLRIKHRWAKLENLIETDAAINGGNSGGALLDMNGRLVGINSAGGGTFNNKGYAIAVDHVRRQVLALLFSAEKLRSPNLGMHVLDDEGRVLVLDVDDRGPAARAGVHTGDRIVALGEVPITWSPGFALQLLQQTAGTELTLHLERKGEAKAIAVTPLPSAVWSVVRQSGLQVRRFAYGEDAERARGAAIALERAFTGDATAEPSVIPESFVYIERVFPNEQPDADLAAGDLLLAVELRKAATDTPVLLRLADVAALRDMWNDRELGAYERQPWKCWVARGTTVRPVEILANRLFW